MICIIGNWPIRFVISRKTRKIAACQWHAFSNDRSGAEKVAMCKAMDALSVPQAQREMYAGLVGKKLQ